MKNEIIKELDDLGKTLYNKYGTDSYLERCTIHDLKGEIKKALPTRNKDYSEKDMDDSYDKGFQDCTVKFLNQVTFAKKTELTKEIAKDIFERGGDWRMNCKNLNDNVISIIEWNKGLDFEGAWNKINNKENKI